MANLSPGTIIYLVVVVVVVASYLTTAMYYSYGQITSPFVDGYVVWMIYDGHMITGDECGPHFMELSYG